MRQAARQDYDAFYASELALRQLQNAPPFSDILAVTLSGTEERLVSAAGDFVRQRLEALIDPRRAVLLGPAPLSVARVNNRFRYRIYVHCRADSALRALVSQAVIDCCTDKRFRAVSVFAENDPYHS